MHTQAWQGSRPPCLELPKGPATSTGRKWLFAKDDAMEMTRGRLLQCYSGGNWFQFPRHFLLVMTPAEAVLMSYFVMQADYWCHKTNKEWFYCKVNKVCFYLCMGKQTQTNLTQKLKQKGFIQTKVRGCPPKRYIRIEIEALHHAICQAETAYNAQNNGNQ
jgi:hypothetical protein